MKRNLRDMRIVITGASSGIGKTLAESLSAQGAKLVLAARRMDRLEELNAQLGGRHLCIQTDVAICAECENLIARATDHFGGIDTLVCNAGYGILKAVHETSADEFTRMFQTNLFGTTNCIRPTVPIMLKQNLQNGYRGQIMIVSSAAARRGLPYAGGYSATKAAQLSLAEALRVELQPSHIAVTSIHPVGTQTEFFNVAEDSSGRRINAPNASNNRHSAAHVITGMVRAIEHPKREVWSSPLTRVLLSINALFPSLGDRVMAKERNDFERINHIKPT